MRFVLFRKVCLLLLIPAIAFAQRSAKPSPGNLSWLKSLTTKDFKSLVKDGKFSAAPLSNIQREKLAAALKIPLQEQIDDFPDIEPGTNDPVEPPNDEAGRTVARKQDGQLRGAACWIDPKLSILANYMVRHTFMC